MDVRIKLEGDFARSYTHGDNSKVVATDSMKNTVYLLAKDHPLDSPESFALHLAKHFKSTYAQVTAAQVEIAQSLWRRIVIEGQPQPTAFEGAGTEIRRAMSRCEGNKPHVHGGFSELMLLKTTDSAFAGFVRDEFTTLPESADRILATKVTARWWFPDLETDFNLAYARIREALLTTFARHKSDAVQQTLFDMGKAALASEPKIPAIELKMPNKHRVPFNFKPFGKEFDNDVYITTDEPSGEIEGFIEREKL
jgi:urate oxidase